MVKQIKALLTPPAYPEDEDKTRVAKLLHVILLALVIFLSFNTVVAFLLSQTALAIVINLATVFIAAALFIVLQRGYVRSAAVLAVSIFWTAVAGVSFVITGFSITIASSFFVLVFLSGVLISKRAAVLFAVLSIIASAIAYYLGNQGQLLAPTPENPIVNVTTTAVNLLVMAIIIYMNQQTLENALARSRQSQRALEASQAELEERVVQRTRDLALANEIGRSVQSIRDIDLLLSGAIRIIQSYFNLYFAQIYLINEAENTLVLRAAEGQAANRLMQQGHFLMINSASINGRAAFEKRPLIVSDTSESPIFRPNPLLPFTRSEMAVPLKTADRILGVLDLQSTEVGAFSEENLVAFEALAGQLAIAMENATLFTERQQNTAALTAALAKAETQTKHLAMVNEMATALENNSNSLESILEISGEYLQELIPSSLCSISLLIEDEQAVKMLPLNDLQEAPPDDLTFPLEDSSLQRAIETKRILRFPEDAQFAAFSDTQILAARQMQSGLVAPLVGGNEVLGTLNLASERPSAYTDLDANFILQISNLLATRIENQRLKNRLQRLATLVETHPDLIAIITMDGRTTYLNAAGLAMIGLTPDYDISQINYSDFLSEEDNTLFQEEALPAALTNGIWTGQLSLHKSDGAAIPIDITIAPNYDPAHNPVGFSVTLRDVAERVQAIDGQRQLTLQLEERLLQVNALQRTMTHEGWSQFLTAPDRLIQGFMFDNEQVRLLSRKDVYKPEIPQLSAEQTEQDAATLAAPMLVRGETIGVLGVRNPSGEPLSPEQKDVLSALSVEVAEALERARLFEEMELAREQMNALYSGSERVVRANSVEEVLHALIESTALKQMDRASFLFFDRPWDEAPPEKLTVTAVWEKSGQPSIAPVGTLYNFDQVPSVKAVTKSSPAIFLDVNSDPRAGEDARQLSKHLGITSAVLFPLVVGDQWFGILTAQSVAPRNLSEEDVRQISGIIDQAASVSQTQRLFEQARNRARREQILREVTSRVFAAADAESILRTTAKEVNRVLGIDSFVYLDGNINNNPEDPALLAHEQTKSS